MTRTWVPKEVAGMRIPKKIRKAGNRLSKAVNPVAVAVVAPAFLTAIFADLRWARSSRSVPQ